MLYNNSNLEKCPNKLFALKRPSHSHIPRISNWHSTWKSLCTKYYNTGKKLQVFLLISLFVSFPKLKLPERRCQPCWLWTWGRVCLAGWLRSSWTIIMLTCPQVWPRGRHHLYVGRRLPCLRETQLKRLCCSCLKSFARWKRAWSPLPRPWVCVQLPIPSSDCFYRPFRNYEFNNVHLILIYLSIF